MLVYPTESNRPLYDVLVKTTVQITKRYENGDGTLMHGTGFLVSVDGVILTAWHVVTRSRTVIVRMLRLDKKTWRIRTHGRYIADVVYRDKGADLAVLKLRKPNEDNIPYLATFGNSDAVTRGIPMVRIGCDHNGRRIAEGFVFDLAKVSFNKRLPRIDVAMPAEQGGSGGPVFTLDGALAGMMIEVGKIKGQPGWVGALPINVIRNRLGRRKDIKELLPNGWPL